MVTRITVIYNYTEFPTNDSIVIQYVMFTWNIIQYITKNGYKNNLKVWSKPTVRTSQNLIPMQLLFHSIISQKNLLKAILNSSPTDINLFIAMLCQTADWDSSQTTAITIMGFIISNIKLT